MKSLLILSLVACAAVSAGFWGKSFISAEVPPSQQLLRSNTGISQRGGEPLLLAQAEATETPPKNEESSKNSDDSAGKPPEKAEAKDAKKEAPKPEDPKARLLLSQ